MRLSVCYPLESRDGTLNKDSKMKNCVVETQDEKLLAVKRPGVTNSTFVPAGAAQGIFWLNGITYVIVGDNVYFCPDSGAYTGGYNLTTDSAITPPSAYNFAIEAGPTYPLTPAVYLDPPFSYPDDLKDFPSIAAIVAEMNSLYGSEGVWEFSGYAPIASGIVNYPNYIGYVWVDFGADDNYIQVLEH